MGFDQVLDNLGDFGRYQCLIFIICMPALFCGMHRTGNVFLQGKPKQRCLLPHEDAKNATFSLSKEDWKKYFPFDEELKDYKSCEYLEDGKEKSCDKYVYDTSVYRTTVVTEWTLTCKKIWYTSYCDNAFMIGAMVGSITCGIISDRFGRKPVFLFSLIMLCAVSYITSLSVNFFMYIICRHIIGILTAGVYLVSFVIGVEMVTKKKRYIASVLGCSYFALGSALVAPMAYYTREWRKLQLWFTIPAIPFITLYWIVPESVRWLLVNNKPIEAKKVLLKVIKVNKINMTEQQLDSLLAQETSAQDIKRVTFFAVYKYPRLRIRMANNLMFYGLSWGSGDLMGNVFWNYFMTAIIEIPSYIFMFFTFNSVSRKNIISFTQLLEGTMLFCCIFLPKENETILNCIWVCAKMLVSLSYALVYVYSVEIFPTQVRNSALSAGSMMGRFGAISAPYVNIAGFLVAKYVPALVYGIAGMIAGLITLILPNTHQKELPDTMDEAEQFH